MAKYILKTTYISSERNAYFPRTQPYEEHELPEACRENPTFCTRLDDPNVEIVREEVPQSPEKNEDIKLNKPSKVEEVEMKAKVEKVTAVQKQDKPTKDIYVNRATVTELVAIRGIGQKLAEKMVAERASKTFMSIDDLNERAPLSFGGNWETLKDLVKF